MLAGAADGGPGAPSPAGEGSRRTSAEVHGGQWYRDGHLGLRLQRGQQGPEGPAGRQGRQPGRDDQPGAAGAAGVHHHHRRVPVLPRARQHPAGPHRPGDRAPDRAGEGDGQDPRRPLGPAAGVRALRCGRVDARDDGDGPQRGPQRRVGPRAGRPVRQRALRVGLLPPADPDVRQDRPRPRRRAVRARPRRGQAGAGHRVRPRPRRRAPRGRRRPVQGHRPRAVRPRLPAGPARAAGPGDQRRLRLVELRPGDHLPPPRAHPQRRRHRGQRLLDGVRQPRHGLRHRRRLHPRPGQRGAGRVRRLPTERAGRGRRRWHPQHRAAARARAHRRGRLRRVAVDHEHPRVPLPRPVRHRVHRRAQQALDCCRPESASGRRGRPSGSPPSWSTRASSTWTRRSGG